MTKEAVTRAEMNLNILTEIGKADDRNRLEHKEIMATVGEKLDGIIVKLNGMPQVVLQHTKDIEDIKDACKVSDKQHVVNNLALTEAINQLKVDAARSGRIAGVIAGAITGAIAFFAK